MKGTKNRGREKEVFVGDGTTESVYLNAKNFKPNLKTQY